MSTPVIFRMWEGEVIALFPTIPSSITIYGECQSYQHIGQHDGADFDGIMQHSRPATYTEYADLLIELVSIGYDDLAICKRAQRWMHELRTKRMQEEA